MKIMITCDHDLPNDYNSLLVCIYGRSGDVYIAR